MELEFTGLSTILDALEKTSETNFDPKQLKSVLKMEKIASELTMNPEVIPIVDSLVFKITVAQEYSHAAEFLKILKKILLKFSTITTSNYGCIETDLKTEWDFVINPLSIKEKLSLHPELNSRGKNPYSNVEFPKRNPQSIEDFLSHEMCKLANLTKPEVVGLRLYTGPGYKALNPSLRKVLLEEIREKEGAKSKISSQGEAQVEQAESVQLQQESEKKDPPSTPRQATKLPRRAKELEGGALGGRTGSRKDPAQMQKIRDMFVEGCKSYYGVPYKKKYHDDSDACKCGKEGCTLYDAPVFLDCCGLVRQVVRDLKSEFGFHIGPRNQVQLFTKTDQYRRRQYWDFLVSMSRSVLTTTWEKRPENTVNRHFLVQISTSPQNKVDI